MKSFKCDCGCFGEIDISGIHFCPYCGKNLTGATQKPQGFSSNSTDLLCGHLETAQHELVLAYNTATNEKLSDTRSGIAFALADVCAELQFRQKMLAT